MKVVKEYLSEDRIPLLQFEGPPLTNMEDENLNITVTKWTEIKSMPEKFATISHVWSDGYGNEEENALHRCQLRYIKRLLNDVGQEGGLGWRTPFWMDTLIIPVGKGEEEKKLRKRAIKQIFRIFKESSYTIVLDVGLSRFNLDGTDKPAVAAMRILGSSWMRRLWTLQEAFLSRKIYFAFEESASPRSYLKDLAGISQRLASESSTEVTTALLNMVNEHLQRMIMSHENETRDKYLFKKQGTEAQDMPARKAAILVASTWRAARWRTTTNSFHETLALATLLDLNHEDNEIAEAGLLQEKRPTQADTKLRGEQTAKKDKLVREFWTEFNKRWPESIPPGIIFLSGERVELEGFGWAPRTWMTAQPVDPPDPLAVMRSTARLDTNRLRGLKVRYPGFLLDAQDRKQILATDQQKTPRFWFPTGPSFLDWYMVEPADDIPQIYLQKIEESDHPLAIIVSRARPGNSPSEIGLLVQIRESIEQNQEDEEENPLFCEIIRRVKISRETRAQFRTRNRSRFLYTEHYEASNQESLRPPHNGTDASNSGSRQDNLEVPEVMISSAMDKRICIAEELESDQVWYVDGYIPRIDEKLSSLRASNKQGNEPRAGRFEGFLRIFNPKSSFGARGSGNFDAKNSRSAKVNVPEIGHSKTIRRTGSVVEQPTTVKQPAWTGFKSIISK
ncbi:putative Heterokaryon incompatibility domain-containing protein [Seiridium unicorne]|uniref:Heterokaryon incompatibility domain-containing protein n=1 Tax=Seiridium unicorne TaxID=138068 RepID=A0ABR2UUK9_9PEZI